MSRSKFEQHFRFERKLAGHIGIERECFVTDAGGNIVPRASQVLAALPAGPFGYELSACQVESRIGPYALEEVREQLIASDRALESVLKQQGLAALHAEVGPQDMPLDIYPDPTGRYELITKNMPREVLLAACRVIGTHVHVGMPDRETALATYNCACAHWRDLCDLGNGSFGERLAIYKQMAPNYEPRPYRSWEHYYETACAQGFAEDPRRCWTFIRISIHGTIEFRMFGATDSIPRILSWARRCHELCQEALAAA